MDDVALDLASIRTTRFADRAVSYDRRDVVTYALACGAGDSGDLRFVYEEGLRVIPSFGQNLCFDDTWLSRAGIELGRVVHGGLDLRFVRPFAAEAVLTARPQIAGLTDKGEGRAALILLKTDLLDGDAVVFTSLSNLFVVGGGGFGGSEGESYEMVPHPGGMPCREVTIATDPRSPLLFRLLGDLNPLHVLPEAARAAKFERPIMHGANTFGLVCHDLLVRFCDGDPGRLKRFTARFSGPLFPGERLAISYWTEGTRVLFRAGAADRDAPVLDGGLAEIA
jgi:acyl dehydratase